MKIIFIQIISFILGIIFLLFDNSKGMFDQMTYVSYIGMVLCGLGVGLGLILNIIFSLIKKN